LSRKHLTILAKFTVSAALIAFLVQRVKLQPLIDRLAQIDIALFALAIAVFFVQLLLTGWRYDLIGRAIEARMPTREALRLVLIGQFFSQTLPSSIGGDAVRAFLASRLGIWWGRAVSAVLCDRAVAMIVLLALATATIPIFLGRIADPFARWLAVIPAIATLGILAVLALATTTRLAPIMRWKLLRPFAVLTTDLRTIVFSSGRFWLTFLISLVVQLGVVATVWLLARSLSIAATYLDCLVLVPPISIAVLVPISIAGWGVREGAMILAFGLVGVAESDALALSVTFGLAQIVVGIPGGVIWMLSGRPRVTAESSPPAGS
jgi:uncharacterized protein (TIRG00374 family)